MSIVDEVKQLMRDAEDYFLNELRASQARALSLPVEEVMRREITALAELLDDPERYSWR